MGVHTYIGGLASMTEEKKLFTKKNLKKKVDHSFNNCLSYCHWWIHNEYDYR